MKAPAQVHAGRCGIFAPSSPFPPERYALGKKVIESLGLEIYEHPQTKLCTGYLAGDDDARLAAFHQLLDDPSIQVLWAARGGYGLHRIADRIDGDRIARANKVIVGFSDICVIHAIAQRHGLISVHGPVVTQLADLGEAESGSLRAILNGELTSLRYDGETTIAPGRAEGRIAGGCLSVIAPLAGSQYLPPLDGAILLLEDVGEATYRIDRMLSGLHLAGVLSRVAGIALGDFVGCNPRNDSEPAIDHVLSDRLSKLGVPVLAGLPFGHGKRNVAVPLGARVLLDASARTLQVLGS